MKKIMKAIKGYYDNDVMHSTLSALYFMEALPTATYPYMIYSFPNIKDDWTFTEEFFEMLVQFTIYSDNSSAEEISDLVSLVKGARDSGQGFDFAEFNVEDHLMLAFEPVSSRPFCVFKGNKKIFGWILLYKCTLERI